jgi:hypothetical protein
MIEIWAMMQNKMSLLTSKGFTFSWFEEKQITIPTTTVLQKQQAPKALPTVKLIS